MDEPEEYIDFMARYKDWISMKRLGIRPDTKPEEVVYHMAGIRTTIDTKSFLFLGIKTGALDAYADSITSGMRKSYSSLSGAISSMDKPEAKAAIEGSCENKALTPLAEVYLMNKLISNLKYDVSVNQLAMSKIFPNLKPPKAPGMGRKKKAAPAE